MESSNIQAMADGLRLGECLVVCRRGAGQLELLTFDNLMHLAVGVVGMMPPQFYGEFVKNLTPLMQNAQQK